MRAEERAEFLRALPALWLIQEVVTGPLSADLFDYAERDLAAVGIDFEVKRELLDSLRVVAWKPEDAAAEAIRAYLNMDEPPAVFRLAVDPGSGPGVSKALYEALASRFRIAEKIWFQPAKLIPDAMLDVALRRIDLRTSGVSEFNGCFEAARLLEIGDDAFLALVERCERECVGDEAIIPNLLTRRLYTVVVRVTPATPVRRHASAAKRLLFPAERNRVEQILREEAGEPGAALCVCCIPPDGQFKAADVLVLDRRGSAQVLEEAAPDLDGLDPVAHLRAQYAGL